MNIAIVSQYFKHGGLESRILGSVRHLQRRGHQVSFIVGADANLESIKGLAGDRVLQINIPSSGIGPETEEAVQTMAKFCGEQKCELLHLHPFITFYWGALTAERLGIPYVVTLHGPASLQSAEGFPYDFLIEHPILENASRVFCVSSGVMNQAEDLQPKAKCCLLPNGVDLTKYRAAVRDPDGEWAVLTRLDDDKVQSVRYFLEVFFALSGRNHRVRIFGEGQKRGDLEGWLSAQSFGSAVRLEGHCSSIEQALCKGFAGVGAMARASLEAGALGLPVILAGYDGVKGLMRREEMDKLAVQNFSGRGLPPIDAGQLAPQMEDLSAHPEKYYVRPWIERNANEGIIWEKYLREIDGIIASSRQR